MKNKLLRQLMVLSRRTVFGFIIQCLLYGGLLAGDLKAQNFEKSIRDIYISINVSQVPVRQVLSEIEDETGFSFAFNSKKVDLDYKLSMNFSDSDLASVLMEISRKSDLKFKRIDNYIHIGKRAKTESIKIEEKINNQELTITGKVTSQEDESGLPGVNVVIKGTTTGVITDFDGNFKKLV